MTSKETYAYLGKIRSLRRQARKLREQIDDLRYSLLPSGIVYDKDKIQTSPECQILNVYAKIDETERQLKDTLRAIEECRIKILRDTRLLPPKERAVIISYYVDCLTIANISSMLGVTERHTFRLRENAISMMIKES